MLKRNLKILELLESQASEEAKQKGLKHLGYGKYANASGKVVAQSRNGKLEPVKNSGLKTGTADSGTKIDVTGPDYTKRLLHSMEMDPWKRTNNIKAGDIAVCGNGKKYRRVKEGTWEHWVNVDDPKESLSIDGLELRSPIKYAIDQKTGKKKQAMKFDIKNYMKDKR